LVPYIKIKEFGVQMYKLRNMLGSKTEEVKGDWKKSHNGLQGLYFSSCNQVINLRSTKLAGHVMCVGDK
jgi:hypothetical protein